MKAKTWSTSASGSLETLRRQTIERLQRAGAAGELHDVIVVDRIKLASSATSAEQLEFLIHDLHDNGQGDMHRAVTAVPVDEEDASTATATYAAAIPISAPSQNSIREQTHARDNATAQVHFSLMGGVTRSGRFLLPRKMVVCSLIGETKLDLRDATFHSGVSELVVCTIIGSTTVRLPPYVKVVTSGFTVLGGTKCLKDDAPDEAEYVLKVVKVGLLGDFNIT